MKRNKWYKKPYLDMTPEEQDKVFLQQRIQIILTAIFDVSVMAIAVSSIF